MKYLVNLTSKTTGKSRFAKIESDDIKSAELKAQKKFPTYTIHRICEDDSHYNYYSAVSKMRKE